MMPSSSESAIPGVRIRHLLRFEDERGWLIEVFRADELWSPRPPAMAYVSWTHPGVTRGPHEHRQQTDMICFPGPGEFELWLWDNRPGAESFGRPEVWRLGRAQPGAAVIPPGVVHAYRNVGLDDGITLNLPDALYQGAGRQAELDEIRHENDPATPFRLTPSRL